MTNYWAWHPSVRTAKTHMTAILLLCCAAWNEHAFAATFEGLEVDRANAISADGATVVGVHDYEAFRWTRSSGVVGLGDLPGSYFSSVATGVSADGTVVVGIGHTDPDFDSDVPNEGFRWTTATGMVSLHDPSPGDEPPRSYVSDVSADGDVVVGSTPLNAFRWTPVDGFQHLTHATTRIASADAHAVSASGDVVVGRSYTGSFAAARWVQGQFGTIGGYSAADVSADGTYIVGVTGRLAEDRDAFRWSEEVGFQLLGDLPGGVRQSQAHAVSADGRVVVGQSAVGDRYYDSEAMIWDPVHGMRSIRELLLELGVQDVADWRLTSATDVSADGRTVIGQGFNNVSGLTESWVASIPEPTSGALMALSLLAGIQIGRPRRQHRVQHAGATSG